MSLSSHLVDKIVKTSFVVVENEHIFASVDQLEPVQQAKRVNQIKLISSSFLFFFSNITIKQINKNSYLLHNQILTLSYKLALSLDDRLQELHVLHMPAASLDAMNKVLDDFVVELTAQLGVVLENCAHSLRL